MAPNPCFLPITNPGYIWFHSTPIGQTISPHADVQKKESFMTGKRHSLKNNFPHITPPPTPTPNFLDSPASAVVGDWSQYAVEVDLSVALHEVHRKSRPFHQRSTNGRVSQCNKPTVGRLLQVLRFTRTHN